MPSCTFFGHRDCPSSIEAHLREVLIDLIEHKNVNVFYVGNNGAFDKMVARTLRDFKLIYTHISCFTVLAYLPQKDCDSEYNSTIFPEGIENVPKRFAISWRNNWMLNRCEYTVTYITHSFGGASKFADKARRSGKVVINLN